MTTPVGEDGVPLGESVELGAACSQRADVAQRSPNNSSSVEASPLPGKSLEVAAAPHLHHPHHHLLLHHKPGEFGERGGDVAANARRPRTHPRTRTRSANRVSWAATCLAAAQPRPAVVQSPPPPPLFLFPPARAARQL